MIVHQPAAPMQRNNSGGRRAAAAAEEVRVRALVGCWRCSQPVPREATEALGVRPGNDEIVPQQ